MELKKTLAPVLAAALSAGASMSSFAAAVDVDDVVTDIGAQVAPITAIGGAVLLVYVAIKAFKWVRRSL